MGRGMTFARGAGFGACFCSGIVLLYYHFARTIKRGMFNTVIFFYILLVRRDSMPTTENCLVVAYCELKMYFAQWAFCYVLKGGVYFEIIRFSSFSESSHNISY